MPFEIELFTMKLNVYQLLLQLHFENDTDKQKFNITRLAVSDYRIYIVLSDIQPGFIQVDF